MSIKNRTVNILSFKAAMVILVISLMITSVVVNAARNDFTKDIGIEKSLPVDITNLKQIGATNYEEWKEMKNRIITQKTGKKLSKEHIVELYNKGYSLNDIEKAESISILYDIEIDEILNLKYDVQDKRVIPSKRTWEEIEADIVADKGIQSSKIKMSEKTIKALKEKGLTDEQLVEIEVLALNYGKECSEIAKEMQAGKSYDQLDEKYWNERRSKVEADAKQSILSQEELEAKIRDERKITDEEIKLCSKYGINKIIEIGLAKDIADRYNTTLEKILKLKSENISWSKVIEVLKGGEK